MDVARIEIVERDALADFYAAAPAGLVAAYGIAARRLDDGLLMTSRGLDSVVFNRIMALGVSEPVRARSLDEGMAALKAVGVKNWAVQVAPGDGALAALLAERKWSPRPRAWAKFAYPAERPGAFGTALAVREIGPADAPSFGALVAEAFGLPPEVGDWIAALAARPRWRVFAAFDGPLMAAAGAVFIEARSSWLGLGATKTAYRGRGAQSALLTARIRASHDAGADLVTTETGVPLAGEPAPSYRNIQRVGFRLAYERPNFGPH
jgi:hypothetical protein